MRNASAAATPSYSAAWDAAHARFWQEDQDRMREYLSPRSRTDPPKTRLTTARERSVLAARMRRYRANKSTPIPPCSVCGGPRTKRNGERCKLCRDRERCGCGGFKTRWAAKCDRCRG